MFNQRKIPNGSLVTITMTAEVTNLDGEDKQLVTYNTYQVQELMVLGLLLQKDIYDEMYEELEHQFEQDDSLLFISDIYVTCDIAKTTPVDEDDYFYITGQEFIPQFRGLHQ